MLSDEICYACITFILDFGELLGVFTPIVQDGVSVYEKLFFDPDVNKLGLIRRLQIKYGYLPAGDNKHLPSNLAVRVKGL